MSVDSGQAQPADRLLYHYWRSSAAYRVRIALNLKGLAYKIIPVHLVKDGGEQHQPSYLSINPQGLVPVLSEHGEVISQSMAICEYLDEVYPQYALLPEDPLLRARVRALTLSIACDIHPLNNLRVVQYLQARFKNEFDQTAWMRHWMASGFHALEAQLNRQGSSGGCLGASPGLFECFLIPQVYNAERFELDMLPYPHIRQMVEHCKSLKEFADAAPENQPDAV